MPTRETTGVILTGMDLGEKDRLLTFYCHDEGLLRLAAPAAKKISRADSGLLQKFCWNDITYYQKDEESLGSINDLSRRRLFSALRQDLNKMSYGSYVLEFYRKTGTEEGQPALFRHLVTTLSLLAEAEEDLRHKLIHCAFRLRILTLLGFRPRLSRCSRCEEEVELEGLKGNKECVLALREGGIICCEDEDLSRDLYPLDDICLRSMVRFIDRGYEDIEKISEIMDEERLDYLNKIIEKFINYHLGLSLSSNRFLSLF